MLFSTFTKLIAIISFTCQVALAAPTTDNSLQTQALNSHNQYRAKHHVGAIKWSKILADHAAAVANTCIFAHNVVSASNIPKMIKILCIILIYNLNS
jgi:hypothetical protein